MMYNSTLAGSSRLSMRNRFVQVEGKVVGRHYVPEQAALITQMIVEEIRQLRDLPDVFVISPFSEIPFLLKKELRVPVKQAVTAYKAIEEEELKTGWIATSGPFIHSRVSRRKALFYVWGWMRGRRVRPSGLPPNLIC